MGEEETRSLLHSLMANTEALTNLNASVTEHGRDYTEGQKVAREHANGVLAKLDNLDRSISEIRLATENSESSRQEELGRIYAILKEERQDRRDAVTEGREDVRGASNSEKDLLREMIREELGERRETRKEHRALIKTAGHEIWKAGGKYIVAAAVLLILAVVLKTTGLSLVDLLGLAGK